MAEFPQGLTHIDRRCDNAGERLVLHQLKRCLSDDYMVWHDTPIGPAARQPDFVIFSPRRGLLILEVKHWSWGKILGYNRNTVELETPRGPVTQEHPLVQARRYAMGINDVLERDPALIHDTGPFKGKTRVPYGWGCVMSNQRAKQTAGTDFTTAFPEYKTLLRDDLDEDIDPYEFEKRLWGMYAGWTPEALTLPQRDRVRWHLFPEIRMRQPGLFDAKSEADDDADWVLPDLMEVMDLQQEQVARTLGEGHRVIHGAAGSGKTMILIFRAQQLAAAARAEKPILVLCYNRALAQRIDAMLRERGVDERVVVRTFHSWCQDLKRSYQLAVPQGLSDNAYYAALSETVCRSVETGLVPGGQYTALLIDEAHDFQDSWLQMAARMVDASSQSLLVLYDDAQSIYQKKRKKFNFASLGIQAQGRTSVLRLNYRNTAEVLALAMHCAQGLLAERAESDEAMRTVHPASAGRRGPLPVLIETSGQQQEGQAVAEHLAEALADGLAPADVVVLARTRYQLAGIAAALRRRGIECRSMSDQGQRMDWAAPCVKLLTMHSAKGLEFPLVYVAGLQVMPLKEEPMEEEVRLLYVAMTRATQRLVLSAAGPSPMLHRVRNSLEAVRAHFTAHAV